MKIKVIRFLSFIVSHSDNSRLTFFSLFRIPKEEMHFQPLEEIRENTEETATHNQNLALFNRLLSSTPSPSSIVGGAFNRTSAQLQQLTRSVSPDSSYSDGAEEEEEEYDGRNEGAGESLPSGLRNDTQSTICSCGGTSITHAPSQAMNGAHEEDKLRRGKNEIDLTMLKISPSLKGALKQKKRPRLSPSTHTNRSTPDLFSFQPTGDQAKVMTPPSTKRSALPGMTLLSVTPFPEAPQWAATEEQEQRQHSISVGSEGHRMSNRAEE